MSRNALAEADDFGFPLCRILSGFWVKVFRFSSTFQRGDVPTALQSLLNEGFAHAHANIDFSATPGSCFVGCNRQADATCGFSQRICAQCHNVLRMTYFCWISWRNFQIFYPILTARHLN